MSETEKSLPDNPLDLHPKSLRDERDDKRADEAECGDEVEQFSASPKAQKKKDRKKRNRAKKKPAVPELGVGGDGASITFALAAAKDHARDVARAAGVKWGDEEPPARMSVLQTRHDAIVDVAEEGRLTLLHIKEHNEFLAVLTRQIADEGEQMKRKFRIANAKQVLMSNSDTKRAAQHQAQAAAIQRRQKRYNNEVAMAQCEVDWLRNSPAYAQAMAFLDEHWVKTAKGDYVSKKDLSDDADTSFEDLLSSMKLEELEQELVSP